LAHAEIESCLEDIATAAVRNAYAAFLNDGIPRTPLLAVVAFCATGTMPRRAGARREDFKGCLGRAITTFHQQVARSNGIREHNIAQILLPAGLCEADLDPLWMTSMYNFGQRRGDTAHKSLGAQTPPDPLTERQDVRFLATGLGVIDARLSRISA
jgi:hypothetical protein